MIAVTRPPLLIQLSACCSTCRVLAARMVLQATAAALTHTGAGPYRLPPPPPRVPGSSPVQRRNMTYKELVTSSPFVK
jgi:hypothetical protein